MALTRLDPNTALVIVDLQKGIVALPLVHPIETIVARSSALAAAFRTRGLPVVLVNVTGGAPGRTEQPRFNTDALPADFAELVPELDRQPDDIVVTKRTWGAFASTDLDRQLKALGVTQVVVTGVATATGVESTARQAYEQGFNVTLAIDAMTDQSVDAHDYSVRNVFPRLGETGSTDEVIALLDSRS
ncbi:isochorismatase family protein [Sphingomonas sp.]|uniref:isochorismatase family protein n=1 Tax=Sphingomonas sp. TaxID=28214 RepID=UPI003D6D07A1